MPIAVLLCPGRSRTGYFTTVGGSFDGTGSATDYAINIHVNCGKPYDDANLPAYNEADRWRTLVGIADGTSNTVLTGIMYIERSGYVKTTTENGLGSIFFGGEQQTGRRRHNMFRDQAGANHDSAWGSAFDVGVPMGLADGTVRLFPYSLHQTQQFERLLSPSDGQPAAVPD